MRPLSVRLSLTLATLVAVSPAAAQRVSFLYQNDGGLGVQREENARRWEFERMGYYTRGDVPQNAQSWFDFYGATYLADVWYVPHTIDPAVLGDKMRLYQRGVVFEGTALDAEFGVADADGQLSTSANITVTASHPVTATVSTGNCAVWSSPGPLAMMQGTLAGGFTPLGTENGTTALGVVETGGALANTLRSNSVATGRRVRLPMGGAATDWNTIASEGLQLLEDAVDWAANYTPPSSGMTAVLVVDENGTLNAQERWRLRRLRYWGFTVVLLWDGASQATYDTAASTAHLFWVSATCDASDVGYKLRATTKGVVSELAELDDELGYSTTGGIYTNASWHYVLDRAHPVTADYGFAGQQYGYTLFWQYDYTNNNWPGSNQPIARLQGTAAAGLRALGNQWSNTTLAVVETGGTLANTYSGNSTAAGRRVRLPWGGNSLDLRGVLSWTDASMMLYNALRWAGGPSTGSLIAHYKLDETSGTTATDSSASAFHGAYQGSPTLGITPAQRGTAVRFDANGEKVFVDTQAALQAINAANSEFSVAFWLRPQALTHSDWRNLVHIGGTDSADRGPLIMMHPTNRRIHGWVSTDAIPGGEGQWTNAEFLEGEWRHVVLVKSGQALRWYVDGVFDSGRLLTGQTVTSGGKLWIGRSNWWGQPDADIDDVRVYSYALSDQEAAALHADLVAHYKLDETTGTTAKDSSVFKNHATLAGNPVWSTSDASLTLDGTGDYASAPSASQYALDGEASLTAWIKIADSNQNSYMRIVSRKTAWNHAEGYELEYNPSLNRLTFGGRNAQQLCATSLDLDSRWRHVAATMVPVGNGKHQVKLYVDGIEVTSNIVAYSSNPSTMATNNFDALVPNAIPLYVGANGSAGDQFNGGLRDVRVYRRALTAQEVFELGGSGMRLHLRLDETTGTIASDSSPYGNHGSYVGSPTKGLDAIKDKGTDFKYTDGWDYVEVPNNTLLENVQEGSYTLAAWFRPNSVPPGTGSNNHAIYRVVGKQGWHLGLAYGNDQHFRMEHWLASGPTWVGGGTWAGAALTRPPGKWYHLVGVVDQAAGTVKLYVDGVLVDTGTFTPNAATHDYGTQPWRVGVSDPAGSEWAMPADGAIDDVRVYARALSAEEVAELHGLVGHWQMDEYSGDTVAVDETVFNQDGRYDNTPALEQEGPYPSQVVRTAVQFDPGDEVDVPHAEHLELGKDNADFSVAFWLKNNQDFNGNWRETFKKHSDGVRRTPSMWLHPSSNRMHVRISTTYSWNEGTSDTLAEFDPGVWRHVAYVKEGSKLSIYVDGVLDRTNTLSGTVVSNRGSLYWGARHAGQQGNVTMDDVRVYQRALRPWEVAELYGNIGRWRLNESSGAVATDSSGMARHGTYMGSPVRNATGPDTGLMATTFDGVDDWVQLPAYRESFADGAAIAAWARPTENRNFAYLLQIAEGLNSSLTIGLGRKDTSAGLRGYVNSNEYFTTQTVQNDVWRHYAMSVTSAGVMSMYRNGVLLGTQTVAAPGTGARTTNSIAASQWGQDQLFKGDLHDVRLYNRPISKAEARALYYGEGVPGLRIVKWVEAPNP